jgi:hypothetical protein
MAGALVQATMPHRHVTGNELPAATGISHELCFLVRALPFGTISRLLYVLIHTYAYDHLQRRNAMVLSFGKGIRTGFSEIDLKVKASRRLLLECNGLGGVAGVIRRSSAFQRMFAPRRAR